MSLRPYKNRFAVGEVLLVNFQNQPAFFIRVERITPDVKKGWWRLYFLILTIPIESAMWILDDEQMHGAEFTMSGHLIKIERITKETTNPPAVKNVPRKDGNIITLFEQEE